MKKISQVRPGCAGWAFLAVLICATSEPAESKDVVELQTQVQLPVDSVQRLQSTLDARFGVLQNVLQQTASSTDQTSQTVVAIEQGVVVQNENLHGKLDINAGQIQSLNDSVNELKSHVDRLATSIQTLQAELQALQNSQQAPSAGQAPAPGRVPEPQSSGPAVGNQAEGNAPNPEVNQAPPLEATFQAALGDYYAARYGVAKDEFQDVVHYYPESDRTGEPRS